MRKISKEKSRAGVWILSGLVFILITIIAIIQILINTKTAVQILLLLAIGFGCFFYGWKKWKETP